MFIFPKEIKTGSSALAARSEGVALRISCANEAAALVYEDTFSGRHPGDRLNKHAVLAASAELLSARSRAGW